MNKKFQIHFSFYVSQQRDDDILQSYSATAPHHQKCHNPFCNFDIFLFPLHAHIIAHNSSKSRNIVRALKYIFLHIKIVCRGVNRSIFIHSLVDCSDGNIPFAINTTRKNFSWIQFNFICFLFALLSYHPVCVHRVKGRHTTIDPWLNLIPSGNITKSWIIPFFHLSRTARYVFSLWRVNENAQESKSSMSWIFHYLCTKKKLFDLFSVSVLFSSLIDCITRNFNETKFYWHWKWWKSFLNILSALENLIENIFSIEINEFSGFYWINSLLRLCLNCTNNFVMGAAVVWFSLCVVVRLEICN